MVANINNNVSLALQQSKPAARPAPKAERGNDVPPESGKDLPPVPEIDTSALVEQINDFMVANSRNLQFRVDNSTNQTVITVVNPNSGEVIRQIPSEEALRLAAQMKAMAMGLGVSGVNLLDTLA